MKIFLTGGTGFIGRNLKEQLCNRFEIHAPPSSELNLLDEKVVFEYVKRNNFDAVIHSATWNATRNSTKDLTKVLENNLRMFFNLARCGDYYGKMIYYGSGAEYDRRHWVPRMNEEYFDTHVPSDDYGFSKYVMAKYTEHARNIFSFRLFGVFGKHEDWEIRFISNACCKAVWDLPITIKQNVFFDYMYIDDLVKITEWFINKKPEERFYNVCTSSTFDLLTLAQKVLSVSRKNLDIVITREELGIEYSGNNSRLLGEMGGYTFCNMDNSINELYQWYLYQKDPIDMKKLLIDK